MRLKWTNLLCATHALAPLGALSAQIPTLFVQPKTGRANLVLYLAHKKADRSTSFTRNDFDNNEAFLRGGVLNLILTPTEAGPTAPSDTAKPKCRTGIHHL